jgi:ribosomal protein S18 acetylase RimI-like enzyme
MHARYVDGLTIRPLRNGDTATVEALFARLGERSRVQRFCGAKPRLTERDLHALARIDENRHALVGYVDRDDEPAALARLVRDGNRAEIAFEVADAYQGRRFGSILARELAADARAAGITELVGTVCGDNPPMVSILRRIGRSLDVTWSGGEREFVVALQS